MIYMTGGELHDRKWWIDRIRSDIQSTNSSIHSIRNYSLAFYAMAIGLLVAGPFTPFLLGFSDNLFETITLTVAITSLIWTLSIFLIAMFFISQIYQIPEEELKNGLTPGESKLNHYDLSFGRTEIGIFWILLAMFHLFNLFYFSWLHSNNQLHIGMLFVLSIVSIVSYIISGYAYLNKKIQQDIVKSFTGNIKEYISLYSIGNYIFFLIYPFSTLFYIILLANDLHIESSLLVRLVSILLFLSVTGLLIFRFYLQNKNKQEVLSVTSMHLRDLLLLIMNKEIPIEDVELYYTEVLQISPPHF